MDWNRNGMNGAVTSQENNQQYFQQSTSCPAATTQSQTQYVGQNACSQASQRLPQGTILKQLLNPNVTEAIFLKIQKAALAKPYTRTTQVQQANQLLGHYNTYNSHPETVPTSSSQSALKMQKPVTSNYGMVSYTNPALHTTQQPQSVPVMQQYAATGYNDRGGQQPMQNTQASVSHVFPPQNVAQTVLSGYSSVRHPVQTTYQRQTSKTNSQPIYTVQNGNSGPYLGSSSEANIPVSSQDYRNSQNYQAQTNYGNYQASKPQQTAPQWNGNYVQTQHTQLMGNFQNSLANSSMQLVTTSTGTPAMPPPPSYAQSRINQQSVLQGSLNQQHTNQGQNYATENVQQPHHSAAGQQEKSSAAPMSQPQSGSISQDQKRRQELIMLLHIYRNVKEKYILLNRENEALRQKLEDSNKSQNNGTACAGSAPLVSSLQNGPALTNNAVAGQLNMPQNGPVLNPPQLHSAQGFQGQNIYNTNGVNGPVQSNSQTGQSFHGNVVPNQVPTSNKNVFQQNNCSVNGGQAGNGSVAGSTAQGQTETLRANVHQNLPAGTPTVHTNNQVISSGNPHDGSWSQNDLHANHFQNVSQSNPVTSESLKTAVPSNVRSDFSSVYTAMFNMQNAFPPGSREAIEAALPLWKSVPQSPSLNKDGPTENEPGSLDAFSLLKEITLPSTNEATPALSVYKPDLTASNASKCVEPQIAIVSPLVQSKEMGQKEKMFPKGQDVGNMLLNAKDNERFNKILQSMRSIPAPLKEEPSDGALPTSNIEISQKTDDPNSSEDIEMSDNDLQISGICTLVEGSSYYNSSIAMMFDSPVKTECDTTSDAGNDHTIQRSQQGTMTCTSEDTNSGSPNTAVVVQPAGSEEAEFSVNEENLDDTSVKCFEIQNDQSVLSPSTDFCDLEASSVSDQLSELLSAFPYGIKNYMSENKLDNQDSPGKCSDKPVIDKESVPFNAAQSAFVIDQLNQDLMPKGSEMFKLTNGVEAGSLLESTIDLQPAVEQVPTPTETVQACMEGLSMQFPDDCFESVCDNPENDIQITLIPQDEITKIFPSEPPLIPKCEQTEDDAGPGATSTENSQDIRVNELNPLEKGNSTVNEANNPPAKDLFCCLFSWLNHTNRNAPKCNCKMSEQLLIKSSVDDDPNRTLGYLPKASSPNLCKSVGYDLKDPKILPLKLPNCEPVVCSSERRKSIPNSGCSQQEETKCGFFENQGLDVDLEENKTLTNEKSFTVSGECKSPIKTHSENKTKPVVSPKCEKLIIKTDFLKGKHLHRGKKRGRERKTPQDTQDVSDARSNIKRFFQIAREILQTPYEEKTSSLKTKSPCTNKHNDQINKTKPSPSSVKTTPTTAKSRYYERGKNRAESHFDKARKTPTVREYLERKREFCNKSYETQLRQHNETEGRHTVNEKSTLSQRGYNPQNSPKRPLSPAKMNVKTKNPESELKRVNRTPKERQSTGSYGSSCKKSRDLDSCHGKDSKKTKVSKHSSNKNKIYLSPCVGSRGSSYDGLNLTKLQIRCSPEKRKYQRRKSLDSSLQGVPPKSETKKMGSPKMLEFKLCPEFVQNQAATQEKSGEPKVAKEKNVIEGIKSKKEAWCNSMPFKKRKLGDAEDQGCSTPSTSKVSPPTFKPLEKSTKKLLQDSQATFNAYKQMYQKQRSKSLDASLGSL